MRRGRAAALVDISTQHVLLRAVADELLACLCTHSKRVDLEFSSRHPGRALLKPLLRLLPCGWDST